MINWTPRLIKAFDTARGWHESIGQVRKYSGEPYFVHCQEVAEIVSEVTQDEDILIATAFHDTQEDCYPVNNELSLGAIKDDFGFRVAAMVDDLTDRFTKAAYPKLNRKIRKERERERLGKIRDNSKTIKISDLLSNTRSIVQEDPNFAKIYLKEKEELLPYLVGGNEELLKRAWVNLWEAKTKLSLTK